jgi:Protein of unknown function (DUF3987)
MPTRTIASADLTSWREPDLTVLRDGRHSPPRMPISAFGPWGDWISTAAEAAACSPDYVAAPLLATVSALIGNARWAQAAPGWAEPPHLWIGAVGDSGNGKSPGADCLMRDVLPEIERRMLADFPDRLRDWHASIEFAKAAEVRRQNRSRDAAECGASPSTSVMMPVEPQAPRLREKVAELLASAVANDQQALWRRSWRVGSPG